jgi:hypothetical protein
MHFAGIDSGGSKRDLPLLFNAREIGECIYCGTRVAPLGKEHAVPYGLNGPCRPRRNWDDTLFCKPAHGIRKLQTETPNALTKRPHSLEKLRMRANSPAP